MAVGAADTTLIAERWRTLELLFHQASDLPLSEREAFVLREAGHDALLQQELEAMLGVAAEATIRLRQPLEQAVAVLMPALLGEGTRCGPWAIDGLIGAGGMGRVYLGHRADGAYQQRVAIKLVANPWLDERQRAFFEFECRMQAQMHHPAIAQIYDAGLHEDERPYLVMEYIDGEAIDGWCSGRRASLEQRVQLLMQVCEGVQHAHQKGVIHRDLKPRNVLVGDVDGRAQPKLIDFGIAIDGLVDEAGELAAGTPGYMSPEQAGRHGGIDVRSDVYSLGVLLHQLLCGQVPSADTSDALSPSRLLSSLTPAAQTALALECRTTPRRLRGALVTGLDAIVRKATDPERGRRYEAVSSLLADLARWQQGKLPLGAAASPWLVARQFLQRHRLPVLAASLVLVCAVSALLASLWALSQAHEQQQVAAQRRLQLERMVAFQQEMLQSVDVDAMGHAMERGGAQAPPEVARDLLERYVVAHALQRLQLDFKDDPVLATELRQSLAGVLASIGRYPAAAHELQLVLKDLRAQQQPPERVLDATVDLADALYREGSFEAAHQLLLDARTTATDVPEHNPLWLRAGVLMARVLLAQGRQPEALALQLKLEQDWAQRSGRLDAGMMELGVGIVATLTRMSQRERALERMQVLLPKLRSRYGRSAPRTLAASLTMADLLNTAGEYEDSLALASEVRAVRQQALGVDHPDTLQALALEGANRVRLAQDARAWSAAEGFMSDLLQRRQRVLGAAHPDTLRSKADMIRLLAKQGVPAKFDQAIAMQRQLLASRERVLGKLHPDTLFSQGGLASMLANTDRHAEARKAALATLDGYRKVTPDHALISATWDVLGRIEDHAGNLTASIAAHRTALRMRDARRGVLDAHTTESASRLYVVLQRMGDHGGMALIRSRYLDPVIAQDPATLNASLRSVRAEAVRALATPVASSSSSAVVHAGH